MKELEFVKIDDWWKQLSKENKLQIFGWWLNYIEYPKQVKPEI